MITQNLQATDTLSDEVLTAERLDEINKYLLEISYSSRLRDSRPEGEVCLPDFNDWTSEIDDGCEVKELP